MKRIRLTVILAVVAVLCLALAACQPPHEHQFGQWQQDETNHWKTCSCGQKSYEGAHAFGSWVVDEPATETEAGSKHAVCTECGYRIEETIPATGGSHQHEFSDRWYGDEQEHWHECACGEKAEDPSAKSEGVMTYAEYVAAELESEVVIETYVQAKQSWWENKATVYTQDGDEYITNFEAIRALLEQ